MLRVSREVQDNLHSSHDFKDTLEPLCELKPSQQATIRELGDDLRVVFVTFLAISMTRYVLLIPKLVPDTIHSI